MYVHTSTGLCLPAHAHWVYMLLYCGAMPGRGVLYCIVISRALRCFAQRMDTPSPAAASGDPGRGVMSCEGIGAWMRGYRSCVGGWDGRCGVVGCR